MKESIQVLVLEDDLGLLNTLVEVLGDSGFNVMSTSDSSRAVELSLEYDFDILVTDVRMSGMDGLQALAKMQEWSPNVCSLVITGFSSEVDTLRALRLGVGEYLQKPFAIEELQAAIDRLVARVVTQRRARLHESNLLGFLRWSLAGFAATPAIEQKCEWALRAAEKARELAGFFAWDEQDVQALELASLCTSLARHGLPQELDTILPPRVLSILQSPHGLENQLLEASQALAQGQALPAATPSVVSEALQTGPSTHTGQARKRRATLALALALEQSDQLAAAVQAYQSLAAPPPSSEGARACLALAQLANRLERGEQVLTYAHQAVAISRSLGPHSLAESAYQAGLLLDSLDRATAHQLFGEAEELFTSLEMPGPASLAHLARRLDPAHLQWQLEHPTQALRAAAPWLLPRLRSSSEPAAQQLVRLLGEDAHDQPAPTIPTLRIFSLGLQEIFHDTVRLADTSFRRNQKARQLLTYLAWERNRVLPDEVLAEIFWPEEGSRGRKNVYSMRSILRKALQPPGVPGEVAYVCRQPQGLGMDRDLPWWHDVEELRGCLRAWEQGERAQDLAAAQAALQRAAELYRGPFLENCYLDWAVQARQQLEAQMCQALCRLMELLMAKKGAVSLAEALEVGRRVLEIDPCYQDAYAIMMRAELQRNHPLEALKLFERAQKTLARELQVEPSLDLVRLHTEARMQL
ncbi:MAG: response regulator [Vulcanimicrobiota bacterium]